MCVWGESVNKVWRFLTSTPMPTCRTCFNSTFVATPTQLAVHRAWYRVQKMWHAVKFGIELTIQWVP